MKKVLVVDDDADILTVVSYLLKRNGFEVLTHATGLHIPQIVELFKPNLVLLDIGLPGKEGTEVCKELKLTHSTPVLFFSAHADKRSCLTECGAQGFIQKPFDIDQLVSAINQLVN